MISSGGTLDLINKILLEAIEKEASDVHLKSDKIPFLRIDGELKPQNSAEIVSCQKILDFIRLTAPAYCDQNWKTVGHIDYSYNISASDQGRFRVNGFYQRGVPGIVFRYVKEHPPTFDDIHHKKELLVNLCKLKDGIILFCGPTGCGKTTTIAAMIDYINSQFNKHIITLEDPIEYSYEDKQSIINQREIGIDSPSFSLALKGALRQDPDIILVGEMRDVDTFDTALRAAETGHLVLSTLHASGAQQSIQRLFEFYPKQEQPLRWHQIASCVRATITQGLLPKLEGGGRVPVVEIFYIDSLASSFISKGEFSKIPQLLENNKSEYSISFNSDLLRLVKEGIISKKDAMAFSPNPKALEMNLKGIFFEQTGLVS